MILQGRKFNGHTGKANNKTKRKFSELATVTFKSQVFKKNLKFTISTSAMRTVLKYGGIDDYLFETRNKNYLQKLREFKNNSKTLLKS